MSQTVAWLGTGLMGAPMAANLLRAGYAVRCYNRTRAKTAPVVQAGGAAFETAAEAARGADVIVTMVTDGPDVEAVLLGPEGALSTARRGVLCIDMTTMSPQLTQTLAGRAAELGFRTLDAPVTGGQSGAINATLSIMAGGARADFEEARPLLETLGQTITYCGDHGAGQSVKLCNQICGAANLLGVCEALLLCRKMGVEPAIAVEVINGGAGASWAMQNLAPKILAGDWEPGFMVETQQKDMRLVAEAAEAVRAPLPCAALAQQMWRSAQAHGWDREGVQAMAKVFAALAAAAPDEAAVPDEAAPDEKDPARALG